MAPAGLDILPWLTPAAAFSLPALMLLAAVYHARRPAEGRNVILNVILGLIALLVAIGRVAVPS